MTSLAYQHTERVSADSRRSYSPPRVVTLSRKADGEVSDHGQLRAKGPFLIFVKLYKPLGFDSTKERRRCF